MIFSSFLIDKLLQILAILWGIAPSLHKYFGILLDIILFFWEVNKIRQALCDSPEDSSIAAHW